MIHLPGTESLHSSLPSSTGMSRRDVYDHVESLYFNGNSDPLNGSLGPFLASCAFVFIVVILITFVLWGVHRRVGGARTAHSPLTIDELADPNGIANSPGLKFPPSRMRIRSPIQRLKLLRSGGTASTIPLWTSPTAQRMPDIVVSCPPATFPVSPSLTTSAAPNTASVGKLEVPGAKKAPLVQLEYCQERPPRRVHAKVSGAAKGDKLPLGSGGKMSKSKFFANKENCVPHADAQTKRSRRVFGPKNDGWSQLI